MTNTSALRAQTPYSQNHEKIKHVERIWRSELTAAQHAVVSFVVDRTLRWNKQWETITIGQMLNGIVSAAGEIIHGGVGLSRSTIIRCIKFLEDRGYIIREATTRWKSVVYRYAINWEKMNMGLPTSKKERSRPTTSLPVPRKKVQEGSQDDTPPVSQGHPPSVRVTPHNNRTQQNPNNQRELRASHAQHQTDQEEVGSEINSPETTKTNPLDAVRKAVANGVEKGKQTLHRRVEVRKGKRLTSAVLWDVWKAQVSDHWQHVTLIPWTPKQRGCASNMIKYMGKDVIPFMEWCIQHWHLVRMSKFPNRDKVQFPENPDFGFLFAFRQSFIEVWDERHFYERMAGNPMAGLIITLRRRGYTEEQATEMAEERRVEKVKLSEIERREADLIERERQLAHRARYVMNPGSGPVPSKAETLAKVDARRRSNTISTEHRPINTDISEW